MFVLYISAFFFIRNSNSYFIRLDNPKQSCMHAYARTHAKERDKHAWITKERDKQQIIQPYTHNNPTTTSSTISHIHMGLTRTSIVYLDFLNNVQLSNYIHNNSTTTPSTIPHIHVRSTRTCFFFFFGNTEYVPSQLAHTSD